MGKYEDFLASKAIRAQERGLKDIPALASHLFPFQKLCVDFALRAGSKPSESHRRGVRRGDYTVSVSFAHGRKSHD